MSTLVAAKLLKPLDNPPQYGTKYFASKQILERAQDEKWLHHITSAIQQHWQKSNALKKKQRPIEHEVST